VGKNELVRVLAERTDITLMKAGEVFDTVFETLVESLVNNQSITVQGFGVWAVKQRPARKAKNLQTGEVVDVPAHGAVTFRPAKALKVAVK
jgi:DNA-binding protein HU-beta